MSYLTQTALHASLCYDCLALYSSHADRDNEVEPAASSVAKPGALKPDGLPERVNSTTHRKEYMRLEARQLLCLRTYTYKRTDHSLIQEPPV